MLDNLAKQLGWKRKVVSISFKKPKPNADTVSIVRNRYVGGSDKRSREIYLGSLRLDADPEDVRVVFKRSKKPAVRESLLKEPLVDNDFTLMKAWLIKNGDQHAASRRAARDERVIERALVELGIGPQNSRDAFTDAAAMIRIASQVFQSLPPLKEEERKERWDVYREKYLMTYDAFKEFQKSAALAGVTKNSG